MREWSRSLPPNTILRMFHLYTHLIYQGFRTPMPIVEFSPVRLLCLYGLHSLMTSSSHDKAENCWKWRYYSPIGDFLIFLNNELNTITLIQILYFKFQSTLSSELTFCCNIYWYNCYLFSSFLVYVLVSIHILYHRVCN